MLWNGAFFYGKVNIPYFTPWSPGAKWTCSHWRCVPVPSGVEVAEFLYECVHFIRTVPKSEKFEDGGFLSQRRKALHVNFLFFFFFLLGGVVYLFCFVSFCFVFFFWDLLSLCIHVIFQKKNKFLSRFIGSTAHLHLFQEKKSESSRK